MNKIIIKKKITVLLYFLLLPLFFALGSCQYLGFLNPAWPLEGSWTITQKPESWEPHATFVFLNDASGYQIKDSSGNVFESGTISSLTDSSFFYTMEQYDYAEELEGSQNYVEYSLSDTDTISMTFYADREKSSNFGTITAIRQ